MTSSSSIPSFQTLAIPQTAKDSKSLKSINNLPVFVTPANDSHQQREQELKRVVQAVSKAKRVAVVCGAGISTAAGIPDFRSSGGLFESLKRRHPEARLTSGKDLFDASLFKSDASTSLFYNMIGEFRLAADQAEPSEFHRFLKELDDKKKLFRVYTQNIDGLEAKAGLTYGVPSVEAVKRTNTLPPATTAFAGTKRKRTEFTRENAASTSNITTTSSAASGSDSSAPNSFASSSLNPPASPAKGRRKFTKSLSLDSVLSPREKRRQDFIQAQREERLKKVPEHQREWEGTCDDSSTAMPSPSATPPISASELPTSVDNSDAENQQQQHRQLRGGSGSGRVTRRGSVSSVGTRRSGRVKNLFTSDDDSLAGATTTTTSKSKSKYPTPTSSAQGSRSTSLLFQPVDNSTTARPPVPVAPERPPSPTKDSVTGSSAAIPRCIPLHGTLNDLTCTLCKHTEPLEDHLDNFMQCPTPKDSDAGSDNEDDDDESWNGEENENGFKVPECPQCQLQEAARAALGERSRGVGYLKPSVVLYGEEHGEGEKVGAVTRRDMMGVRPDLLIVAGTSLKVPGTKLIVRELAKVIRPPPKKSKNKDEVSASQGSATSSQDEEGKGGKKEKPAPVHVIFLNFDFPTPAQPWKDIFDVWVRGDVQEFVRLVQEEEVAMAEAKERKEKEKEEKKQLAESRAEEREKKKADKEEREEEEKAEERRKKKNQHSREYRARKKAEREQEMKALRNKSDAKMSGGTSKAGRKKKAEEKKPAMRTAGVGKKRSSMTPAAPPSTPKKPTKPATLHFQPTKPRHSLIPPADDLKTKKASGKPTKASSASTVATARSRSKKKTAS